MGDDDGDYKENRRKRPNSPDLYPCGMRHLIFFLSALLFPTLASADCYEWPLREGKGGRLAYDADTIYITMPGLPPSIEKMSVRVNGIDAPEIRGKCGSEKTLARTARDFVNKRLRSAKSVAFCKPRWGKYAGRVLADVYIDGNRLADTLIEKGIGRKYDGGKRRGWCH